LRPLGASDEEDLHSRLALAEDHRDRGPRSHRFVHLIGIRTRDAHKKAGDGN
jgi:hypothetical protein